MQKIPKKKFQLIAFALLAVVIFLFVLDIAWHKLIFSAVCNLLSQVRILRKEAVSLVLKPGKGWNVPENRLGVGDRVSLGLWKLRGLFLLGKVRCLLLPELG